MGQCDEVYLKEIGDTEVVIFNKKSENNHVSTIVIRGPAQSNLDYTERTIESVINAYKVLTKDNRVSFIFFDILIF